MQVRGLTTRAPAIGLEPITVTLRYLRQCGLSCTNTVPSVAIRCHKLGCLQHAYSTAKGTTHGRTHAARVRVPPQAPLRAVAGQLPRPGRRPAPGADDVPRQARR